MHAITFGVHHSAAMALLQRWFGAGQQGRAQALYAAIGYGLGGGSGGIVAGWMWARIEPAAAFYGAAAAAALGWAAVAACRRFEYAGETMEDEGQSGVRR
jgi:PPP family 3-phenylpropionic acid transporter